MECPHCGGPESYAPMDLMIHLRNEHPMTWIMWVAASVSGDGFTETVEALLNIQDDYEYWSTVSNLLECYDDIDKLAPICEPPNNNDTVCAICLCESCEENATKWRKMNGCGHVFCAPCLEQWLHLKHMCPLCREVP